MPRTTRGRLALGSLSAVVITALATAATGSWIIGLVAGVAVALVVAWYVERSITRPLSDLAALADRDPHADVRTVSGAAEIERLTEALHRASRALRDEYAASIADRDQLARLVDDLADAIFIADEDGFILRTNAAARAYAGGETPGRRLAEAIREHEALEAIDAARDGREHIVMIERAEPRRFQRVVVRPLQDRQLLVVIQDLTMLRRLETVRGDFVANVSHELRRPITALKAMAETLEEGALNDPEAARDFVGRMHREIDGLAQMVNELLTLTRIETGRETLTLEPLAPSDLLRDSARRMGPLAARAGVTLLADRSDASTVRADRARVDQVLTNLVHNAVKFTPAGGTVQLAAENDGAWVMFSVRDTGVGIEAADLERIFERFYKTDRARSGEGTGLGLAIAKHLVQAHGGRIEASSGGAGRGATFRFTLPRALT